MVEYVFSEPLTDEQSAAMSEKLDPCLEIRRGAWRRSALALDRRRMICEFEAPDAEAVRDALRTSQIAFERVWTADVFAVEDYPEHMKRLQAVLEGGAPAGAGDTKGESAATPASKGGAAHA
jgi:hypothetical protein